MYQKDCANFNFLLNTFIVFLLTTNLFKLSDTLVISIDSFCALFEKSNSPNILYVETIKERVNIARNISVLLRFSKYKSFLYIEKRIINIAKDKKDPLLLNKRRGR